jgi:hypothetical protein
MYSLLLAARAGSWDELDVSSFEYDRFLEHTQEVIKTRFLPLTDQAVAALIGMPVLFAYEFKRDASPDPADEELAAARVGRLVSISRLQRGVEFRYEFDPEISSITTARLRTLAHELDIDVGRNENYRSHWAVKDVDLLAVLRKEGLIGPGAARMDVQEELRAIAADVAKPTAVRPKIFVVHGRNDGLKNEVGRFLGKIGFDDIILHEQANVGRTLITKFEDVAKDVVYAIVLMTPDDVGGLAGESQSYRARQNVIFELGYFVGKLGRDRVAAIVVGEIEKPGDYQGVVYIPYDAPGAWKGMLAREFKVLGLPFDLMAGL